MKPIRSREQALEAVAQIDNVMKALAITVQEAKKKAEEFGGIVPDSFDLRGIGSLLHDFYTAIEDVFEIIVSDVNGAELDSMDRHKRLLATMSMEIPGVRPAVVSEELAHRLGDYLRFRHVFRNVYGHLLDWKRLKPLLNGVGPLYGEFQRELGVFREFLVRLAHELG